MEGIAAHHLPTRYGVPMASIRQRSPGHFEIRAYAGRDASGRKIELHETYVHHRRDGGVTEAKAIGRKLDERAATMRRTPGSFADLLSQWLAQAEALGRSPNTLRGYRRRVPIVARALGSIPLAKLSARDIDRWYGDLMAAGKSASEVHSFHRVISAALSQGERWGSVDRNVARLVTLPRTEKKEKWSPSPLQVRQLVELAEESTSRDIARILVVASLTGLRRAELCGLRWHDIDWDARTIHVRRSIFGRTEIPTKGRQDRLVPASSPVVDALTRQVAAQQADAAAIGLSAERNGYVFSADELGFVPRDPHSVTQFFDRLRTRAVIRHGWPNVGSFHGLRRFAATQLRAAGYDSVTVAAILGHAQVSTTDDIYAQAVTERMREAAEALGAQLESAT